MYEAQLEFPEGFKGEGLRKKIPSMGEVGILELHIK